MTAQLIVPWFLFVGNFTSALCTGRRKIVGWPILVFTQLAFVVYGATTGQPGFAANIAMASLAVFNWRLWVVEPPPPPGPIDWRRWRSSTATGAKS